MEHDIYTAAAQTWLETTAFKRSGDLLSTQYGVEDISDEAREQWMEDIDTFFTRAGYLIEQTNLSNFDIGHAIALSRNGLGGFTDIHPDLAAELTDIASDLGLISATPVDGIKIGATV